MVLEKDSAVKKKEKPDKEDKEIEKMFQLGVHFGHSHSKKHPKMDPFVYGTRNNIDLIDLAQTKTSLEKALEYLKSKKKSLILFVATKPSARKIVKALAEKIKMPYVTERWLGGTLTNFEVIKKRIDYLKDLEAKEKEGELEKYTKKERVRIHQEIERIKRKLDGLRNLDRLPDLLFVVDVKKEKAAIKEAHQKNITLVGICDTNGDPGLVDCPIFANDEAVSSLRYIMEKVEKPLS